MISPDKEKKIIIPKLNSAQFNIDNYNNNNSILMDRDKMRKYAVGWCYGEDLSVRPREDQIAVMYEVCGEQKFPYYIDDGKYWCHLGICGFIDVFIPTYFDED